MKDALDGLLTLDIAEERISELEDMLLKTFQTEKAKTKITNKQKPEQMSNDCETTAIGVACVSWEK